MKTDQATRPARTFPIVRVMSLVALGLSGISLMTTHNARVSKEREETTLKWASENGRTTFQASCRNPAECEALRSAVRQKYPAVHPVERRNAAPYRFFDIL